MFVDNDDDAEDEDYQADYQDYLLDKQSTSASRRRQVSRRRQGGRDGDDEISDENDPNYREKTVPEKNFSKFEGYISTLMPDIKAPAYLKDTAWAQQINIWRKALDDRLWNRQVNEVSEGGRRC